MGSVQCWALAAMVAGSLIASVEAVAQEASTRATLEEVIVTGRVQKLYRAPETTVGKMPGDPLDIPQATQVITTQLIEDQGARDVTDLYRNISGVSFFSYAGVTFRGFRQEGVYYDGLRGDPFIGFSVPQLFNIGLVEVLKGPAGMLYGPGSPGGTINYVTKTPSDEFSAEVKAVAGNYDRRGGAVEITGPLIADRLSGRAGVFYEDRDSFRRNAANEGLIGDASLTYHITGSLDLTGGFTRYDQELPGNRLRGVPVELNGNFLTDTSWNHNEPTDFLTTKADVYQARLSWRPAGPMQGDLSMRYFDANEAQEYHEQRDLLDTDGNGVPDTITREFRDQRRGAKGLALVRSRTRTASASSGSRRRTACSASPTSISRKRTS